jgi:hypothetical protein
MSILTSQSTVTFTRPFRLDGVDERQPAGEYLVDIDQELIEGLSFLAYRRVAALVHIPAISQSQTWSQVITVAPAELDAMLECDRDRGQTGRLASIRRMKRARENLLDWQADV